MMKRTGRTRRGEATSRSGAILAVVVTSVALLGSLALLFAMLSGTAQKENEAVVRELRSASFAESVLHEAYAHMTEGGVEALDLLAYPQVVEGVDVDLVVTLGTDSADLDDDLVRLVAVAESGSEIEAVELVVRTAEASGPFTYGIFGRDAITLNSNSFFDAWESAAGDYASQQVNKYKGMHYAESDTSIASNGGISLDSNSAVFGDARPGVSSSVSTKGSSKVFGSTASLPEPYVLETLVQPSISSPGGNISRSSGTQTLASGDHYYKNLTLDSTAKLIVTGPARLLVKNLEVNSNAALEVDASGGPVEIWVTRDFELNSNAWIAPTSGDPADVSIWFASSGSDVLLDSNTYLIGTLYAPDRLLSIKSNAHVYGAVAADEVHLDSNAAVHYDKTLGATGGGGSGAPEVLSWRPVADPR